MRIKVYDNAVQLWASANDTCRWAHRPGAAWPCSTLAGKRFFAEFDSDGLLDFTVNGRDGVDIDGHEFNAITSDLLTDKLPQDHPVYFVTVGQFRTT